MFWPGALRSFAFVVVASLVASGCGVGTPTSPDAPLVPFYNELRLCVDEINRYRATVGRPLLQRSAALDAFAAAAAERDGTVHSAHDHFRRTNGGDTASAETEILWWHGFAVKDVIQQGLAQMWRVGPGGEHYDILSGPYTEVGCGVFVNGAEVTVTQDFR